MGVIKNILGEELTTKQHRYFNFLRSRGWDDMVALNETKNIKMKI
jgi:hypothetical protein